MKENRLRQEVNRREGLAWNQAAALVDALHTRLHRAVDDVDLGSGYLPHLDGRYPLFRAGTDEVLGDWETKAQALAEALHEIRTFKRLRGL